MSGQDRSIQTINQPLPKARLIDRYDCDRLGIGLEVFNGSPTDGIFGGLTYYRPKQDDGRALGDGYYGYQRVGDLAAGLTLLRTYENPGGNAAADALMLVRGLQHDEATDTEEIVLVAKERFGNRCASGLSNVDVPSIKSYRFTLRATPFDFMVPGVRETLISQQLRKLIDFRLTARRNAKAARVFLRKAMDNARLYQPLVIITDKAHSYRKVLAEFNRHRDPGDQIRHIDRKYLNNRIEGDHSALKKLLNPMRGFKILRSAKATLQGIEAIRTIKNNHIHQRKSGPLGEIEHLHKLFGLAA